MKRKSLKKSFAMLAVLCMTAGLAAGCGNAEANAAEAGDNAGGFSDAAPGSLTAVETGGPSEADAAADGTESGSAETLSGWDASNDITVISREDGSGTRGAFIELFGLQEERDGEKLDMTTQEAQITNSTAVMLLSVSGDEYAIGYASLGSLNESVNSEEESIKALKIDGAEATAENIQNGAYKIARPFNIAVKKDLSNETAKDFIAYILSEKGQQVIADNGYIALSGAQPYEGSSPSGKVVVGGSSSISPVMEKLIEAYKKENAGAEIELQTTDSTTGMTSAADGSYDIGMASRELKDSELKAGLTPQVIATDGIAVIVNRANPLEELRSAQVKAIYTGEALTWEEAAK